MFFTNKRICSSPLISKRKCLFERLSTALMLCSSRSMCASLISCSEALFKLALGYVACALPFILLSVKHPSVAKSPRKNAALCSLFDSRIFFGARTVYVLQPKQKPASRSIWMNVLLQLRTPYTLPLRYPNQKCTSLIFVRSSLM